ncbi:putative ammonium transporter 1 [Daphnia carinata]|uniref:putative ammonium transporter 1 n=1 Tax=Daphnia carinata TaxID=120202 RepID=UPI0025795B16|nr:putative ammonium transporter 1 [Daphnia carinata]
MPFGYKLNWSADVCSERKSSLTIILQPGFALYELGAVRPKNVVNVAFRNFINTTISTLTYWLTGFALAFGDGNGFCGLQYFGLVDLPHEMMAQCFYQYTFAAIASTIPSGVVHERCSTIAFVSYTALTSGFIYPIAAHWVATKNGWLHQLGFDDFAFSGVIHAMSGSTCLVAAYLTGPRMDRYSPDGKRRLIPPHSFPQMVLGAFIFLVGMVAFNAGSQGSISQPGDGLMIAKVTINTLISAATSAVTGLIYHRFVVNRYTRYWDPASAINGSFVGMVAICAGCNKFQCWGAFTLGVSSYLFYLVVQAAVEKLEVDDVVDGISIQIGGGYVGLLSVPLLKEEGLLTNPSQNTAWDLLINAGGGIVIMCWSFSIISLLYIVLRYFGLHRVSASDEHVGLDMTLHREKAYEFCNAKGTPVCLPL